MEKTILVMRINNTIEKAICYECGYEALSKGLSSGMVNECPECGEKLDLIKGVRKAHSRKTKSGKVVMVKQSTTKRDKKTKAQLKTTKTKYGWMIEHGGVDGRKVLYTYDTLKRLGIVGDVLKNVPPSSQWTANYTVEQYLDRVIEPDKVVAK